MGYTPMCSLPVQVSWDWDELARKGTAAEDRGRYVIRLKDATGAGEVLVSDPAHGMWHREDGICVPGMAHAAGKTWMADETHRCLAETARCWQGRRTA